LALASGCRQGELLGLIWSNLDLAGGVMHVRQQLQVVNGAPGRVDLKTAKSRRSLPPRASVVALLQDHRTRQRFLLGDAWSDGGHVFVSSSGTPLDSRNVTQKFQRVLAAAGLRRMRFHDLRHSAATWLLLAGVPDRVIMQQLGHSH